MFSRTLGRQGNAEAGGARMHLAVLGSLRLPTAEGCGDSVQRPSRPGVERRLTRGWALHGRSVTLPADFAALVAALQSSLSFLPCSDGGTCVCVCVCMCVGFHAVFSVSLFSCRCDHTPVGAARVEHGPFVSVIVRPDGCRVRGARRCVCWFCAVSGHFSGAPVSCSHDGVVRAGAGLRPRHSLPGAVPTKPQLS